MNRRDLLVKLSGIVSLIVGVMVMPPLPQAEARDAARAFTPLPDYDIDLSDGDGDRVLAWLENRYGADTVREIAARPPLTEAEIVREYTKGCRCLNCGSHRVLCACGEGSCDDCGCYFYLLGGSPRLIPDDFKRTSLTETKSPMYERSGGELVWIEKNFIGTGDNRGE